jgi:diacylglycerol O-acyltransferase / wax synthase
VATAGNMTLGVRAISYAGQFNVTAVADRELCPDLDVFLQGFQISLLEDSIFVESS